MGFGTKINLNDSKSQQLSGQTLSLSGITHTYGQFVVNSGATLTILPNHAACKILTSDASGNGTWQFPAVPLYNLDSPSVCTVGGLCAGTILTGKTAFEILSEILVPELFGVLTNPSSAISASPSGTFEIGCTISTLCITGSFNRGCINPQYCSASAFRSGTANTYCFSGCQIVGSYLCTTSPVIKCATNYVICASQTWAVCVAYDAGVQPKGSKGTNFNSPLIAGTSNTAVVTLTGIYPYYWGKLTSGSRPTVTNSLVTGGTKVVLISTGVLPINFNSASNEYTWLAIPATTPSKTCWFVNALDNGRVNNSPSDKYPDECQLCISSGQGCWSNICYKVYMSGTVGAISATLCFS